MKQIVWGRIFDVTALFFDDIMAFREMMYQQRSVETEREMKRKKRGAELDSIFKKLYEDRVLERITVEQFQMLSDSYSEEHARLAADIPEKESAIQRMKDTVSNTDCFVAKAKRYTDITELTPELLRLFIQKIVIYEKTVKYSKHAEQTMEIHYSDIGYIGADTKRDKPRQKITA